MSPISPKKILADFGVSISCVAPAGRTRKAARRDTQGWLVEFVGPSGVGKSTLSRQLNPILRQNWFFERHAKGLMGKVVEDEAHVTYLRQICAGRLKKLQDREFPLERIASIGQRVFEVVRLGLVTKSQGLPRGFIMDDGIAHYFAEQILEYDRDATEAFLEKMAFVFLLPDKADKDGKYGPWKRAELDIYCAMRDLFQDLGCPVLALKRSDRADNPGKIMSFIQQDVLHRG
jgi:hypothetical protein